MLRACRTDALVEADSLATTDALRPMFWREALVDADSLALQMHSFTDALVDTVVALALVDALRGSQSLALPMR